MAYSVYKGATDISDYVVDCPPIPLVNTTHDNIITLPSMQITVIDNNISYAKDDVIKFKDGSDNFARFVIEEIDSDYESRTKTLQLVDALKLLERVFVAELETADYQAVYVYDEDRDENMVNKGYSMYIGGGIPYRSPFVTLTYFIKAALFKAGIETLANIDVKSLHGEIWSGFEHWEPGLDEVVSIYKEELCFHPYQINKAKLVTGLEQYWQGATLLEMVMYACQVLDAQLRWTGSKIKLVSRGTGSAPANDDIYKYKSKTWLNNFDLVNATITYGVTTPAAVGFAPYVGTTWPSMDISSENWAYPEDFDEPRQPKQRTAALMRHCPVHYRKHIETAYYCYEMHGEAYTLGEETMLGYMFARQYARVLSERFPGSGVVEEYQLPADHETLGERPLLRLEMDIVNQVTIMEC